MQATFTIDRATRMVLHDQIVWDAPDFEGLEYCIRDGEADKARTLQAKLKLLLSLLDDLDWFENAARDEYEVGVDVDQFASWLSEKRQETEVFIADDTATLAHQEAGHTSH